MRGRAVLLLGRPSGTGETQQMKILGEDTQANLESSEIRAQKTLTERISNMKKNATHSSHFCTIDRLRVHTTHPCLCCAVTALLGAQLGQETGKGEKGLETEQWLRKRENPISSRRPLNSSSPSCLPEGETTATLQCCGKVSATAGASPKLWLHSTEPVLQAQQLPCL